MTNVITVDINAESIPADSKTTSTITATLTDGTDPILTSTNLTFTVTPAMGCELSSTTQETSTSDGTASITATASLPGSYTITVSETNDELVKTTGTLNAVMPYTITVAPTTNLIASLNEAIELRATVQDSITGDPIVGVDVNWSVDTGGLFVKLDSATLPTDSSGMVINRATCSSQGVLGSIVARTGTLTAASCDVFFSAPTVPVVSILNADDDHLLTAAEIAEGVYAYIPDPNKGPYTGGDKITLYWGKGSQVVDSKQFPLDSTTTFPIPVNIKSLFSSDCLQNGDYDVFYVFTDITQNTHCSRDFPLTVDGVVPPTDLPAPTFPEATNNTINADVAAGGTTILIRYSGMAVSDTVTVNWQEFNTNNDPVASSTYSTTFMVSEKDVSSGFHAEPIPESYITAMKTKGTAQASYTVLHNDGTTQVSAIATVNVVIY
ncbi:hypothetical protein CJP72_19015 [Citrobacter sp. NCU1]|uniref:hypothetical protein n=1 Tax=Citrobacter sp. NCU1 TaxID=2026683 RepID=UPI0013912B7F|nr:hypothetical protein [Citrobacter sp. NCU1]NDO82786.1 hypothetical protein [Citrobacter sp. NCU1]